MIEAMFSDNSAIKFEINNEKKFKTIITITCLETSKAIF